MVVLYGVRRTLAGVIDPKPSFARAAIDILQWRMSMGETRGCCVLQGTCIVAMGKQWRTKTNK